jgi:hypothetical protein
MDYHSAGNSAIDSCCLAAPRRLAHFEAFAVGARISRARLS